MGSSSVARDFPVPARRISNPVADPMVGASPGWYYDADDVAIYRWFDGANWTEHRSDIFTSGSPIDADATRTN